jgi:aspartate kinase
MYVQLIDRVTTPQIIVQKYGGACLATPDKVRAVAAHLRDVHARGLGAVVVVSAMGKATDELVRLAYQISPNPHRRELDMLLTTGERVSMALLSMALVDLGVPAISFTGSQAGVLTDESHSQARIVDVRPHRVKDELARGRVVVLAGFQGVSLQTKEITTLGRGGSDVTAVAMAAALKATRCEIVKEVEGVCTADPRIVTSARSIPHLDFTSLSEMCFWGAKVLHSRSVQLAAFERVPLVIKQWGRAVESTRVTQEVENMETGRVLSVNSIARVEHVRITCASLADGFETFARHLKERGLAWPQVLGSSFGNRTCHLTLTTDDEALDTLLRSLGDGFAVGEGALSAVTLTCFGGVSTDLPHGVLKILGAAGVEPKRYLLSPSSLSLFIEPRDRVEAVRVLHAMVKPT